MSYTHKTHLEVEYDIRDIADYFIDEVGITVALSFLDAIDDTIERVIQELNNHVFRAAKFDDIYGVSIKASKDRKNYAKNFEDYYIWYEIDKKEKRMIIWAVDYGPRDTESRQQQLKRRRK